MANTQEKWQEIANRGLQDKFDPQTRLKFDEAVKRGLITIQGATPVNEAIEAPAPVEQPQAVVNNDFIPTDANLAATEKEPAQQPTVTDEVIGGLDTAKTIVSSAVAEPVAGIIGGVEAAGRSALNALGFDAGDPTGEGVKTINTIKDFISLEPSTDLGKRNLTVIGEMVKGGVDLANVPASGLAGLTELLSGQGLEQATATVKGVQDEGLGVTAGERILEETGSPALATLARSAPTAALEFLGLKGLKASTLKKSGSLSNNAKKALKQAAPTVDQIKGKARQLYKELDETGTRVKAKTFDNFVKSLNDTVKKAGIDKDLHKESTAVMRRLGEEVGADKTFSDLNTLRQIASDAAGSINPKDARIGNIILNKLDSGIDALAEVAGKDSKSARQLWRRAKVAESIGNMVEGAGLAASGLENGLRIEARKILRSKKKIRGFSSKEIKALKELDEGSSVGNAAKFLGKFGISEGKATSMLGAAVGGQIGSQLAGKTGAAAALTLGQIAKQVSQKITSGKAKFADQLVKAGGDGRAITRAYLKNTPASQRSVSDLTELLLDPKISAEDISKLNFKVKVVEDAKFFAQKIKQKAQQAGSTALIAQPELDKDNK